MHSTRDLALDVGQARHRGQALRSPADPRDRGRHRRGALDELGRQHDAGDVENSNRRPQRPFERALPAPAAVGIAGEQHRRRRGPRLLERRQQRRVSPGRLRERRREQSQRALAGLDVARFGAQVAEGDERGSPRHRSRTASHCHGRAWCGERVVRGRGS